MAMEEHEAVQETHLMLKELTAISEDNFEEITEKEDENNKTAKVRETRKQPESKTIAQPMEQDIRESSAASALDTQDTVSDQVGTGTVACTKVLTNALMAGNQMTMAIKAPMVISPKEWHYLHSQWLHGIMWAAMGNKAHPNIPCGTRLQNRSGPTPQPCH